MKLYYDEQELNNAQLLNRLLYTGVSLYKSEKRDFFQNHKYIFNVFSDLYKKVFSSYYSFGGSFGSRAEIAKSLDMTENLVSTILQATMTTLQKDYYKELLVTYTDEDMCCMTAQTLSAEYLEMLGRQLIAEKQKKREQI